MSDPLAPLYGALEGVPFPRCVGCGQCCHRPWLLTTERARFPGLIDEIGGVGFLTGEPACACKLGTACGRYADRPLDCRLYPLDIVEHDGALWWSVFLDCAAPDELAATLIPLIPELERRLTSDILGEFTRQIAVTRAAWAPYREGRYRLVRPVDLRAPDAVTASRTRSG